MSSFLQHPRLPKDRVSLVLISGDAPWLQAPLANLGVEILTTPQDSRLPKPVTFHPDLQVCPLPDKRMFALRGSPLAATLRELGFDLRETQELPGTVYPQDVRCGGLVWENYLIGNPKGLDKGLTQQAQKMGLELIAVRQGYCACSIALVDQQSAITADRGLYHALTAKGFQMLLIQPGHIQLPGYDTGFLGGCCGKLAADKLSVTGQLDLHPDGQRIRSFLEQRGVTAVELTAGPLIDVGGIVPLLENS